MSLESIKRTSIWKNTLAQQNEDPYEDERELLRQSFTSFRSKAADVVNQISKTVPELTIHDITHLDALWQTASLICGEGYEINPLEAFVLGGAILLHDAALCFEAYEKGLEGIRSTVTWKDIYASLSNMSEEKSRLSLADFSALRALHAEQAAKLVEFSWKLPDSDTNVYLIDDSKLRTHLGGLIGKIAASHHWDLDKLSTLGTQVNAIQGFPAAWRINPVKIACILRCADAAHICGDRAPDFLYALLKRNGISFEHWQGQNRLAGPDIDATDPQQTTMIYTSIKPFYEHESKSWWLVYDLISLVDQEIKASNELLGSLAIENLSFQIKQVKGAQSFNLLKKYVRVEGWDPIDSKIHVSNIEKLVTSLGGEQLYASTTPEKKFEIAIRELIQNARDSVRARTNFDQDFEGKILVKVEKRDGKHVVSVEDNGLGMSQRVLTGPLLDFGSSFWTSSLVHTEFPGLASSSFKSVGKFGIGFYSVFMIADQVAIATKPWQQGIDKTKQLIFREGLSLRPLFKPSAPDGFKIAVSCRVELVLIEGMLNDSLTFETIDQTILKQTFDVPIQDYLARLCAGLDVNLYYSDGQTEIRIHTSVISKEFDVRNWLHKISFSELQPTTLTKDIIDQNYSNIEEIKDHGTTYGLAAFNLSGGDFIGVQTIGGFSTNPLHKNSHSHLGLLELRANSAKRDSGDLAAPDELMKVWAENQLSLTNVQALDLHENAGLVNMLCKYKIDPSPYALLCIKQAEGRYAISFDHLVNLALTNRLAFFIVQHFNFVEPQSLPDLFEDCIIVQPMSMGEFYSYKFIDNEPQELFNLFSLLHRALIDLGKKPIWTVKTTNNRSQAYQSNLDAVVLRVTDV